MINVTVHCSVKCVHKPIDHHQNGERGTVAAGNVLARGHYMALHGEVSINILFAVTPCVYLLAR